MDYYKNNSKDYNDETVFGIRPIIEAINAGKEIDRIFIQNGLRNELFKELMALLKEDNIPYKYVPVVKLNKITRKNHQGVIAYISPISFDNIEQVIPGLFEKGIEPLIMILDKITDVRNFGAILRTAESTGVNAVVFPSQGAALLNAGTVKSSAGAIYNISLCRSDNLKITIDFLKNSGLKIVAATEKGTELYFDVDLKGPLAIIMGSEGEGVSGEYLKRADMKLMIPMLGKTASLNVSVAAGVLLYEVVRQRSG
ncbi:MAG: 23S rRNA (guanosine(2251)-2'-O)-methyltransferase RlmB [Bacteroidetes bacterium]|nr:23S rRNA (guanosine(2251)-2'-O)-methyltransferase RlmB [Bacteroidota bacterium]MBL6942983.1 23S rRNA (guanosine(2251)-2'-O)-methyltransferase RlmB [Bacteroidales bacterium]